MMKFRLFGSLSSALILGFCLSPFLSQPVHGQQGKSSLENTAFQAAEIKWNTDRQLPSDIRMDEANSLKAAAFLSGLRGAFGLPDQLTFVAEKENAVPGDEDFIQYDLHYKGLELSRTRYIVHTKGERVTFAHGHLVGELKVDLVPSLDRQEAYGLACSHLGLSVGEAKENAALMSHLSMHQESKAKKGKLLLSAGYEEKRTVNYKLAYSFDITTTNPLRRYDVEVDAHSGELIAKYPSLYHENIPTLGKSLYNDMVDIVISDTIFKEEWPDNDAYWHPDNWNAYQGTGLSWWVADTATFTPGGYNNVWHVVLETDPFDLTGDQPVLEFYHRYALEGPAGASDHDSRYDGWDGINVRISSDGGETWEVLTDPFPAYTCTSLWSFGDIHNEGPGVPGWAGSLDEWTRVSFDLSSHLNNSVLIRFDFASDAGYSSQDDNELFGWQIDNIEVRSNSSLLYSNSGTTDNIQTYSTINWVGEIEGKFRLRETSRGKGIATLNAENGLGFSEYVDFVQNSHPFLAEENSAGVGVHWASGKTYDYYLENFDRKSYDNDDGNLISYANWVEGDKKNNAFWAGTFSAYGAGDGVVRGSFGAIDVVGHEVSHGVTEHAANLIYQGESGALNESFSDIFGAAIEFYAEGEDGDWLVGEDIYFGNRAMRSMENPKEYQDPDTYLGEFWLETDSAYDVGGVHTNSGVQNFWFYLLSEGGSGENDDGVAYQVAGLGIDDASAITYRNLTQYLLPDSRYGHAAKYSIQAAEDLFGPASQQVLSVRDSWEAVGIYMEPRLYADNTQLYFMTHPGLSKSSVLNLWNKGVEDLSLTDMSFSDPGNFSLETPLDFPITLGAGERLHLQVVFSPSVVEAIEESLIIESTDPLDPLQTINLTAMGTPVSIDHQQFEVQKYLQFNVGPNPFSERILISYSLPQPDDISIEIFDITGKLVYHLKRFASGSENVEIIWGDLSDNQNLSAGGVYVLTFRTSTQVQVKKIVRQ